MVVYYFSRNSHAVQLLVKSIFDTWLQVHIMLWMSADCKEVTQESTRRQIRSICSSSVLSSITSETFPAELLMSCEIRTLPCRIDIKQDMMKKHNNKAETESSLKLTKGNLWQGNQKAVTVIKEWHCEIWRFKLLGQESCCLGRSKSKIIHGQNRKLTGFQEKQQKSKDRK